MWNRFLPKSIPYTDAPQGLALMIPSWKKWHRLYSLAAGGGTDHFINFAQEVQAVLPLEVHIEQVDIWFQDEMRIGQRGTQTRLCARKGTRPRVVRQQQSESAYIFGAVCPQCDTAVGLVLPFANTQTMALRLEAISLAVPPGRHAVLILDQAWWHTTLKLPNCLTYRY